MIKYKLLLSILFLSLFSSAQSFKSDTLDILHYDISIDLQHLSTKKLQAHTQIQLTPRMNGLNSFTLDLLKLQVDSVFIDNSTVSFTHNDTILNIQTNQSLNASDTIILDIYYGGTPAVEPYNWGGFHFLNDSSLAYNLGVAFEDYPHNYGRAWFPCIDDFKDKATYSYHIKTKDSHRAVCSGELVQEEDHSGPAKTWHWELAQEAPTYLVAVAVGNLDEATDIYYGIQDTISIHIYERPSNLNNAVSSLQNVKDFLSIYENRFGPYPFPRVVYVGTTKGAMEHIMNISIPRSLFNGSLTYETLFAHELAHNWFGNLVTCATAEDMWLNEGWATFSEEVFTSDFYGYEAGKLYARDNHYSVLLNAHLQNGDGAYYPVSGLPQTITYGTHAYDKGADVAHTLRGYLGETVFYDAVKAYLNQKGLTSQSSIEFRDFLTNYTGIDMTDFFDGWVFQAGHPHFSIDSFVVTPMSSPNYIVDIAMRQKLNNGAQNIVNSNRVPIRFMDNSWNTLDTVVQFNGATESVQFQIPFAPDFILVDPEEELMDATTDFYKSITTTGMLEYKNTYFKTDIQSVGDSAFLQITHNWVAPDSIILPHPGLTFSDYRYWTVKGIFPAGFQAKAYFQYRRHISLDGNLMTNTNDELALFYRKDASEDWYQVPTTKQGASVAGYLILDDLMPGEYTLAVWDEDYIGMENIANEKGIYIYPNPANGVLNIAISEETETTIRIYDTQGRLVLNQENKLPCQIETSALKSGIYFVQINDNKGKQIFHQKINILR